MVERRIWTRATRGSRKQEGHRGDPSGACTPVEDGRLSRRSARLRERRSRISPADRPEQKAGHPGRVDGDRGEFTRARPYGDEPTPGGRRGSGGRGRCEQLRRRRRGASDDATRAGEGDRATTSTRVREGPGGHRDRDCVEVPGSAHRPSARTRRAGARDQQTGGRPECRTDRGPLRRSKQVGVSSRSGSRTLGIADAEGQHAIPERGKRRRDDDRAARYDRR